MGIASDDRTGDLFVSEWSEESGIMFLVDFSVTGCAGHRMIDNFYQVLPRRGAYLQHNCSDKTCLCS